MVAATRCHRRQPPAYSAADAALALGRERAGCGVRPRTRRREAGGQAGWQVPIPIPAGLRLPHTPVVPEPSLLGSKSCSISGQRSHYGQGAFPARKTSLHQEGPILPMPMCKDAKAKPVPFQKQGPCQLPDTFGRATRCSAASALAGGFLLCSRTPTEKLGQKTVPSAQLRLTGASLSGETRAGSGHICQPDPSLPVQRERGESLGVPFLPSHRPCRVPAPAASGPRMPKGCAGHWKGAEHGAW